MGKKKETSEKEVTVKSFDKLIAEGIKDADKNPPQLSEYLKEEYSKENSRNIFFAVITITVTALLISIFVDIERSNNVTAEGSCWSVSGSQAVEVKCSSNQVTHKSASTAPAEADCPQEAKFAVFNKQNGNVTCLKPIS